MSKELARIMEYGLCHEDVTREGLSQPCEKTAVAVRIDPEDGDPYPVCAFHTRGEMVPLTDLASATQRPVITHTDRGAANDGHAANDRG